MGIGGISPWQLLLILVIVLLIFGTKKLRGIGSDLGGAIKGFKKSMAEDEKERAQEDSSEETAALNENAETSEQATAEKEKEPNAQ